MYGRRVGIRPARRARCGVRRAQQPGCSRAGMPAPDWSTQVPFDLV